MCCKGKGEEQGSKDQAISSWRPDLTLQDFCFQEFPTDTILYGGLGFVVDS